MSRPPTVRPLTRFATAAGGLPADLALYLLSAAFALLTAMASTLLPHRAWGALAAPAYAGAAVLVLVQLLARRNRPGTPLAAAPARAAVTALAWLGAALVPLVAQAVQRADGRTDRAQEEVVVVEDGGQRLLHTGSPYLGHDAIAALPADERLLGYLPYQPGMAMFGLPRAMAGAAWWTDARIWFAVVTAAALVAAVAAARRRVRASAETVVRAAQFATVLPICALTLATGGDDLPVLAFCLLALVCCAAGRFGAAGLAVGAAAALKLLAWPVLVVLAVLAVTQRRAGRFLAGALGLPVAALMPAVLVDADAVVENVLRFPLGAGLVSSPARSPLPGYLLAQGLPGGRLVAAALLLATAAVLGAWLLRRPPRTAAAAALFCGYGLLAAILLMPSTRFGYLLYPAALLLWAPALRPARAPDPVADPALAAAVT